MACPAGMWQITCSLLENNPRSASGAKTRHRQGRKAGTEHMTKLYGYDKNDDGIMLNKRIY